MPRRSESPASRQPHPPHAFVFGDTIGRKIADPKKQWRKCCREAGIIDLHFHDFRHEGASRLLEAGWPLHYVQAMLGHANTSTTSTYLNVTLRQLHESMKRHGSGRSLHNVAQEPDSSVGPVCNADTVTDGKSLVN